MSAGTRRPPSSNEPLALVGIGCRYPGGIRDPQTFWSALRDGVDGIVDIPQDRWDLREFYDADPRAPGKMYVRQGGFLQQPLEELDAQFFGLSPREAGRVDPQQRLLLETLWEAFEDAGLRPSALKGGRVGVFVGGFMLDSMLMQLSPGNRELIDNHTSAGSAMTILSARLAYCFDFRGPVFTVDTACSSSLVAVHLACQSVWSGESELAVAGGVNAILHPETTVGLCKAGLLSPDARCKAFDSRANGYVRGEGAGVVLIRPLSAALASGDRIYAVIRGTAINSDGQSEGGMSVPSQDAQEAVLRDAYAKADVSPSHVSYVEAHGTGTAVGDATEARALGTILGEGREVSSPLRVGSVKSNIGHTEGASGIAGLIKASLCLYHRQVPRSLHVVQLNPNIPFDALKLRVVRELEPLEGGSRGTFAGVNSFGYGGTNAHAVLQAHRAEAQDAPQADGPFVLALSARSEPALRAQAEQYAKLLSAPDVRGDAVAYAAAVRRDELPHRLALVASDAADAARQLSAFTKKEAGELHPAHVTAEAPPKVAWVYTGMGPQWWGMGRDLMEVPAYADAVRKVDAAFVALSGWSVLEELSKDEASSRMARTEVAQAANFAVQVGVTELLRSWGLRADAMVGHSVGEVGAAWASGALTLEEAAKVALHRGRLQSTTAGSGGMLALEMSAEEAARHLKEVDPSLAVAAINSANAVTVAGPTEPLAQLAKRLAAANLFHRALQVEVPYHSPVMDPLVPTLKEALQDLAPKAPSTPLWSTVTGAPAKEGELDGAYWCRNMRDSVLFAPAVQSLLKAGYTTFLEVGPHPVLNAYLKDALKGANAAGEVLHTLNRKRPGRKSTLQALAKLFGLGVKVPWKDVFGAPRRFISLPTYPWQRERHWTESAGARTRRLGTRHHPLLGRKLNTPHPRWEAPLSAQFLPYVGDHKVDGEVLLPGAAFCEAAIAASRQLHPEEQATLLEDVELHKALILGKAKLPPILHNAFDRREGVITVHSRTQEEEPAWTAHATLRHRPCDPAPRAQGDLAGLRARFVKAARVKDFYSALERRGYAYGPAFRHVLNCWRTQDEVFAEIQVVESPKLDLTEYHFHPAVLDACLHATLAGLPDDGRTFLPVRIKRLIYRERPGELLFVHAQSTVHESTVSSNVRIFGANGDVLMELDGLEVQALSKTHLRSRGQFDGWLWQETWEPQPAVSAAKPAKGHGPRWVVLEADPRLDGLASRLSRPNAPAVRVQRGEAFEAVSEELLRLRPKVREDVDRLLRALEARPVAPHEVVFAWPPAEGLEADVQASLDACAALTCLVQALDASPLASDVRLWVLTRGAHATTAEDEVSSPGAGMLWSLARVVRNEHPRLRCTLIDLPEEPFAEEGERLVAELTSAALDEERALRAAGRCVGRVSPIDAEALQASVRREVSGKEASFDVERIATPEPGRWVFHRATPQEPGPGQIRMRVSTVSMPFSRGTTFGGLCAGTVEAVGPRVSALKVGDPVVGFGVDVAGSSKVLSATQVLPRPPELSAQQASALLPQLFARHALRGLAHVRAGEKVLVWDDGTGAGPACGVLAESLGARVYVVDAAATPQATPGWARGTFDARSPRLVDEVQATTGGGVDVAIISGDRRAARLMEALLPNGRLVRRASRGSATPLVLEPRALSQGFSLSVFDLDAFLASATPAARELVEQGLMHAKGHASPGSVPSVVDIAQLDGNPGRVDVVSMEPLTLALSPPRSGAPPVDPAAAYVITGGFGGVGLAVAQWLADAGARCLVLVGRQGATTDEAKAGVETLTARGVRVVELKADVARKEALAPAFDAQALGVSRVAGVVHAAGAFDFDMLAQLTEEKLRRHVGPKVLGAWNLDGLTRHAGLDFFVLISSTASTFAPQGGAAYSAANGYLDGLARYRRSQGMPALAVNLGAVGDVGVLTQREKYSRSTAEQGFLPMAIQEALRGVGHVLQAGRSNAVVAELDWRGLFDKVLKDTSRPRFVRVAKDLAPAEGTGAVAAGAPVREVLKTLEGAARLELVVARIREVCARALGMAVERLSTDISLETLGLDSLMASQLREDFTTLFEVSVPTMTLLRGPTISQLGEHVLELMSGSGASVETLTLVGQVDASDLESALKEIEAETESESPAPARPS